MTYTEDVIADCGRHMYLRGAKQELLYSWGLILCSNFVGQQQPHSIPQYSFQFQVLFVVKA